MADSGVDTTFDVMAAQVELAEQKVQLERVNVVTLRQQQLELAQKAARAGIITEGDVTRYRTSADAAWQDVKSHAAE